MKSSTVAVSASTSEPRGRSMARSGGNSSKKKQKRRFVQHGKASWYGRRFHGKKTASGERYNMNAMTAAHKKLPFHTIVRVTRLSTKKSVVVRINDRGPYVKGRVIDLSRKAAASLKMLKTGVVKAKVEVLKWGSGRRKRKRRHNRRRNRRRKRGGSGSKAGSSKAGAGSRGAPSSDGKREMRQGPFGKGTGGSSLHE